MPEKIRIGLVGYGVGGRLFHAPYIRASAACDLVGVVARSPRTVAAVAGDFPDGTVATVGSLTELLSLGVDAVVVSTPPDTRRDLVLEAVAAGVAVVADKPFAPSADEAQELVDAAADAGVVLNVFHNRRFDTDVVTARGVVDSGRLGRLQGLDLRLDLDEPGTVESGPQGGLLRDLGSHVVDQALQLLGPVSTVWATLDSESRPEGETNVRFLLVLGHTNGATSRVSASKVDHLSSKEIRVYGTDGAYVSDFTDVQAEAVKAGRRPADDRATWGVEDESRWGVLRTADGTETVPSAQGDYTCYYDRFADAVAHDGPGPVPGPEGVEVLRVLDAVAVSAREGRTVTL